MKGNLGFASKEFGVVVDGDVDEGNVLGSWSLLKLGDGYGRTCDTMLSTVYA